MEIQFKRGGQGWKEEEGFSAGKTRSDLLFNKAHFGGHSPSIEADRQTLLIM